MTPDDSQIQVALIGHGVNQVQGFLFKSPVVIFTEPRAEIAGV